MRIYGSKKCVIIQELNVLGLKVLYSFLLSNNQMYLVLVMAIPGVQKYGHVFVPHDQKVGASKWDLPQCSSSKFIF